MPHSLGFFWPLLAIFELVWPLLALFAFFFWWNLEKPWFLDNLGGFKSLVFESPKSQDCGPTLLSIYLPVNCLPSISCNCLLISCKASSIWASEQFCIHWTVIGWGCWRTRGVPIHIVLSTRQGNFCRAPPANVSGWPTLSKECKQLKKMVPKHQCSYGIGTIRFIHARHARCGRVGKSSSGLFSDEWWFGTGKETQCQKHVMLGRHSR